VLSNRPAVRNRRNPRLRDRRDVYRTSGTPELLPRNRIVIGMNIGCDDALADKRQVDALEARIVAMTVSLAVLVSRVAAVEMQHD
jgi:hypothetical protein